MPYSPGCMFCEPDEPCPTHDTPGKKSKPRKKAEPKQAPVAPPVSTDSDIDFTSTRRDRFGDRAEAAQVVTEDDLVLHEIVSTLWPILSNSSREKYRHAYQREKTPAEVKERSEIRRKIHGLLERG